MTNAFLPQNYEVPKSSGNYLRLSQGDNVFRILSAPVLGWEDWNEDNKPVRYPYGQKPAPLNPKRPVRHFWAMVVWHYNETDAGKKLKILEITQISIQNAIKSISDDPDWGSPFNYDLNITRKGEKFETEYQVIAKPPKPLHPEIEKIYGEANIDLNKLFTGEDPFGGKKANTASSEYGEPMPPAGQEYGQPAGEDDIRIEDIPFG